MKERPIIFSAPMVRAILDGRKTMTRRVVKPQPSQRLFRGMDGSWWPGAMTEDRSRVCCPYGVPGDRLWVREAWRVVGNGPEDTPDMFDIEDVQYRADRDESYIDKYRPSIHMPRRFSRLTLEIVSVRVERLQEISGADAIAEGCVIPPTYCFRDVNTESKLRKQYELLWDSINGKRHPWESNPWVWVIEFRRVGE